MALTGFRYPKACKITETSGAETLGAGFAIAKGVKVDATINTSKQVLYADDGPAESVNIFTGGTGTLEGDDISLETAAKLAGATYSSTGETSGEVVFAAEDTPPFFRYGHIGRKMVEGVTKFVVTVYMKVQFDIPVENLETQGANVTLKTTSVGFTLFRNLAGDWRKQKAFDTEAAAVTYLNGLVNIT